MGAARLQVQQLTLLTVPRRKQTNKLDLHEVTMPPHHHHHEMLQQGWDIRSGSRGGTAMFFLVFLFFKNIFYPRKCLKHTYFTLKGPVSILEIQFSPILPSDTFIKSYKNKMIYY